ncbi:MAG TPA: hypothetical protein VFE94_03030 [Candidatus Paceibacterota bacterium]|nr:hypothetical protein [Candidatus Paceibacterota bacterium]
MIAFRNVFPQKPLLVTMLAGNENLIVHNAHIARDVGVSGVFIVGHNDVSVEDLQGCYLAVQRACPNWWVGIKYPKLDNEQAIQQAAADAVSGVWLNCNINVIAEQPDAQIKQLRAWQKQYGAKDTLLFGELQEPVWLPGVAAYFAARHVDVVLTKEKDRIVVGINEFGLMKRVLDGRPLGVITHTPENVLPYADCVIVPVLAKRPFVKLPPYRIHQLAQALAG